MATAALHIRTAMPADAEALSEVIFASYSRLYRGWYPDDMLDAALPMMSRANPQLLASGTYYVAEISGEAAGCGGWTKTPPGGGNATPGIAHIRHFATHPDHIRKGVARSLIEHCLKEAGRAGVRLFKCMSSLPAEGFYARMGFRRVEPTDFVLRTDIRLAAVNMERGVGE
jgi:GNAT superfamily N-acetyltransferase